MNVRIRRIKPQHKLVNVRAATLVVCVVPDEDGFEARLFFEEGLSRERLLELVDSIIAAADRLPTLDTLRRRREKVGHVIPLR